ncbi:NADPH-dependent FMN reductase [Nocardioides taihuensis]|uniref:NADPH-dependent FMN reductase n=1 Tax=Nocardioides taihuensis TaxID=1835606 RepID=A0ABW0BG63_9ACTN
MTSIGYVVGSLSRASINRRLAACLADRAPAGLDVREIPIVELPLYNYDLDDCFPAAAVAFKRQVEGVDALLFVTPEYNRSIPGVLKNALDWGSRPWGDNSFAGLPVGIAGTGLNSAGTAVAQSHLRSILGYLGASLLGVPELCLPWHEGVLDAEVTHHQVTRYWEALTTRLRSGRGPDHQGTSEPAALARPLLLQGN